MSHTINNRSKKILDILFKNNIDVSGLNILRKFAEDWTREEAEARLVPGSEGMYDSGSTYTLGTFFDQPHMGGTPAYELFPDLGLEAARKLIKMHKEKPLGSTMYTIVTKRIDKKIPEVAQEVVDILVEDADTYNYFQNGFFEDYPEAIGPILLSLLRKNPASYFYEKHSRRNKTDKVSMAVKDVSFPEIERDLVGGIIDGLDDPAVPGSNEYKMLYEYGAWKANPEAAASMMQDKVENIRHWPKNTHNYFEAYPERTKAALMKWAEADPYGFLGRKQAGLYFEALKLALSNLAEKDPGKYFHVMAHNADIIGEDKLYNQSINHRENITKAVNKKMQEGLGGGDGPRVISGPLGQRADYFFTTEDWAIAMKAVGLEPTLEGRPIKRIATENILDEANDLLTAISESGRIPQGSSDNSEETQRNKVRLSHIAKTLFDKRYNRDATTKSNIESLVEMLPDPRVVAIADMYAKENLAYFFEEERYEGAPLYKKFPEVARNNVSSYIERAPKSFFKKELHKEFPDFIDFALIKYKGMRSDHRQSGFSIKQKIIKNLLDYFQMKLDNLDSEYGRAEQALNIIRMDMNAAIKHGIAKKYPNVFLDFLKNLSRSELESFDSPKEFFKQGLYALLENVSDEPWADKLSSSIVYGMAKSDPSAFFSMQKDGIMSSYYSIGFLSELEPGLGSHRDDHDSDFQEGLREHDKEKGFDKNVSIAKLYPEYMEIALEAFLIQGRIRSFYFVIDEFDIELQEEDEEDLIKIFIYGHNSDGSNAKDLKITAGDPPLNISKLFKYMKDSGNYSAKDKFPELIERAARHLSESNPKSFEKYEAWKLYPNIKYKNISALRNISDKDRAIEHFKETTNALVDEDLPDHIRINSSIYQQDQRPDDWEHVERFTISQNNTNPNDLLYDINKRLIHAGDGVGHTNVGASGFTSAWALAALHGPVTKHASYVSSSDHASNLRVLEAVEDLKQYFWQLSREDKNEEVLSILKKKNVESYLADEAATDAFHKTLQSPAVGKYEEPMTFHPAEAGLGKPDLRDMVEMIDRKIGIPDYKVGGLVYIVLRNLDAIKAWSVENQPEWLVKVLADSFRPIINLESNPEEDDEDDDTEDFPEETLVIEQYQSDYPVVYDRIFLGNLRDGSGEHIGKEYDQLNSMIQKHLDKDLAKKWIKENGLSDKWQEFLIDHQALEGTEQVKDDLLGTFFISMVESAGESRLPIEIAPDVKDARKHFDIISKVYPYLVIINTIEAAKRMNHKYVYVLKNAPYYASIQNAEKAKKLYKHIPELVATPRSVDKSLSVSNKVGTSGYDTEHYEDVYEIPANDESISILRAAAQKLSGQNDQYDFSLTPAQNRANRPSVKKDSTWDPTPEKIERLKELSDTVKTELSGVDVPDFFDPVSIMRYLNSEVKSKIVPRKKFNSTFGPIMRELGKLSRASRLFKLMSDMLIKTSHTEDRALALRRLSILRIMNFIKE